MLSYDVRWFEIFSFYKFKQYPRFTPSAITQTFLSVASHSTSEKDCVEKWESFASQEGVDITNTGMEKQTELAFFHWIEVYTTLANTSSTIDTPEKEGEDKINKFSLP